MKTNFQQIINSLPYTRPFKFVDKLFSISENGVEGEYTFTKEEYFYEGHFINNPVTPGVILTECMAQIGVACLGIFLLSETTSEEIEIAMSSTSIDFLKPVYPGERVRVISEKEYFRFDKLKCKVKMLNEEGEVVCKGTISGMVVG